MPRRPCVGGIRFGNYVEPRENPPLPTSPLDRRRRRRSSGEVGRGALRNGRRVVAKPGSAGTGPAGMSKMRNFEAQGRAAHPGLRRPQRSQTPTGFHNAWFFRGHGDVKPFQGFGASDTLCPGCAARTWAGVLNAFGVEHSSRSAQVSLLDARLSTLSCQTRRSAAQCSRSA